MSRAAGLIACLAVLFAPRASARREWTGPQAEVGNVLYGKHCVRCHGVYGRGDGPDGLRLDPRPADLTRGNYKLKTTLPGTPPTDGDLYRTVTYGVPGTGMPGINEPMLTPAERYALVAKVKALAPNPFADEAPRQLPLPQIAATADPQTDKEAQDAYKKLGCPQCHGPTGRGDGPATVTLRDAYGNSAHVPDLSVPASFKGGSSAIDVYLRLTTGMDGSAMPSYFDAASNDQRMLLATFIAKGGFATLPGAPRLEDRGRYLAQTLACAYCHTPIDQEGRPRMERDFAGGTPIDLPPFGHYFAANLTPDPTGIAGFSDEQVVLAITSGRGFDGRRLQPLVMPWPYYSHLVPEDVKALVAYLRTLRPVSTNVPSPSRYGGLDSTFGKLRTLISQEPVQIEIRPTEMP